MNCPKCASAMQLKEKLALSRDTEGNNTVRCTQNVWYCRDCMTSIPAKPEQTEKTIAATRD